jgi:diadenosine tetraphosphate (Ap4A) HIT family hydrolase
MAPFEIHPQLLADCHRLGRFDFCHVLLNRNAAVAWFILVPECSVGDLLDLPEELRNNTMKEAALVSEFIKRRLGYPKVNLASIGNVVAQLHLHVVGRRPDDLCWPSPVWGNLQESRAYRADEIGAIVESLQRQCRLRTELC